MVAAQEAFGAVDGVQRPVARPGRGCAAQIDPGEHLLFVDRLAEALCYPVDDGGSEALLGVLTQRGGVLLADHEIAGQMLREQRADDGLGGEVGDRDRALVLFLESLCRHQPLLHGAAYTRRSADRPYRCSELCAAIAHRTSHPRSRGAGRMRGPGRVVQPMNRDTG